MKAHTIFLVLPLACLSLAAQEPRPSPDDIPLSARVLVVYNRNLKDSVRVADYYVARRHIPAANKCAISPPMLWTAAGSVAVPGQEFDSVIKAPIRKCLAAVGRKQILYIVFTYQTPYKLSDVPPRYGVSLDQYVADIWDQTGPPTQVINPYYAVAQTKANVYQPFVSLADYRKQPGAKTIYSVWRLDGPSRALAQGLVDKAILAEQQGPTGQGCFDWRWYKNFDAVNDTGYDSGEWDIYRSALLTKEFGLPVTEDSNAAEFGTPPAPLRCDHALLYAGWYSLNHYNDAFTWNPGAIGLHLDSLSAANPREGPSWCVNAIKKGITVTAGALEEPDLEGLPHPDGIFRDLFEGANVGDAFLRNTTFLKWMLLNFGDPLYRPFPARRPAPPANANTK